jgi:hypothetical protein
MFSFFVKICRTLRTLSGKDWTAILFLFGLSVLSLYLSEKFFKVTVNGQNQSTLFGLILRQISSVLAISGALAVVLRRQMYSEIVALVADKIRVAKELLSSGIEQVLSQFGQADFPRMIASSKSHIDISVIYASTWLKANLHSLVEVATKPGLQIRFICLDPNSPSVKILEQKYADGGEVSNLKQKIEETISLINTNFINNQTVKSKVSLYLQKYLPQHCIYRFDDFINIIPYALSPGRRQFPIFTIKKEDGKTALFESFMGDLETLYTKYANEHLTNNKNK